MTAKSCAVSDCDRDSRKGRWCGPHSVTRPMQSGDKKCRSKACDRAATSRGVCGGHYNNLRRGVSIDAPLRTASDRGKWRIGTRGYIYRGTKSQPEYQHRIVMSGILGRPLLAHKSVHHINGIRHDNRPENLELWSKSQPSGQRVIDKVAWAKQILALYGKENLS